jgi:arabinogalactan oligomer/maltooligosaccharide transport system permease protein
MVPWSLAGAEGFAAHVGEPLMGWVKCRVQTGVSRPISHPPERREVERRALWGALPWLLPGLIVIGVITFYPLIFQMAIALTDLTSYSLRDGVAGGIWREAAKLVTGGQAAAVSLFEPPAAPTVRYTGLALLGQVIDASADLFIFELLWTALVVTLQAALGIGVALLLHRPGVRWRAFWMTLFILPWALPEFIGALAWGRIFHPGNGWLTLASQDVPRDVILSAAASWRDSPALTLIFLSLAGVWMGWPLMMLAASAGLKLLPREVHEAAQVDGATAWQRFRAVTLPMLLPLLTPVIILRAIAAFNQFYLFVALEPDYPHFTFSTLVYYLAMAGFGGGWYGAASAISLFTVAALLGVLIWFNRWSKAGEGVAYA